MAAVRDIEGGRVEARGADIDLVIGYGSTIGGFEALWTD